MHLELYSYRQGDSATHGLVWYDLQECTIDCPRDATRVDMKCVVGDQRRRSTHAIARRHPTMF